MLAALLGLLVFCCPFAISGLTDEYQQKLANQDCFQDLLLSSGRALGMHRLACDTGASSAAVDSNAGSIPLHLLQSCCRPRHKIARNASLDDVGGSQPSWEWAEGRVPEPPTGVLFARGTTALGPAAMGRRAGSGGPEGGFIAFTAMASTPSKRPRRRGSAWPPVESAPPVHLVTGGHRACLVTASLWELHDGSHPMRA